MVSRLSTGPSRVAAAKTPGMRSSRHARNACRMLVSKAGRKRSRWTALSGGTQKAVVNSKYTTQSPFRAGLPEPTHLLDRCAQHRLSMCEYLVSGL